MIVNEIFNSIDGEGLRTGELSTFIRLAGCKLKCSYCDAKYSQKPSQGNYMSVDTIVSEVEKYDCKNITLTGGEPLQHENVDELIDRLINLGYKLNIETNGSIDISQYAGKNVLITMDYKLPSSKMEDRMIVDNLALLKKNDVVKFVVSDIDDLKRMYEIVKQYKPKAYIYISPVYGKIEPSVIVDFMKQVKIKKARVQIQLHKIIWDANTRGV